MTHKQDNAALAMVLSGVNRLRDELRLPWPGEATHAVSRLGLARDPSARLSVMVGLLGGASSGKSTLFDNLLDGHLTSRITARGHATLGPILAAHEARRADIDKLFATDWFLAGMGADAVELDDDVTGSPERAAVVYHGIDALRDVILFIVGSPQVAR